VGPGFEVDSNSLLRALVGEPQQPDGKLRQSLAAAASVGFEVVVPVALLSYGGNWLDGKMGTAPWLLLIGMLLGMAVGFYNLFRRVAPRKDGPDDRS
jgi:ATP synthase protein I